MISRFIPALLMLLFAGAGYSQEAQWINYTDLKSVTSIAYDSAGNQTYCASKGGLFAVDNQSGAVVKKYSNLDGLININLTSLAIDRNRRLWIGASDGSISILDLGSSSWKYIFDIKNSTESNKIINFLYPVGNFMFVATGYGIHKVSVSNLTFIDAPYYKLGGFPVNTTVYALASSGNLLYAATKSGVAWGNYVNSNLNNPASWSNYNVAPLNAEVRTVETSGQLVFAGSDGGFSYFNGTSWAPYPNGNVSSRATKDIQLMNDWIFFIGGSNLLVAPLSDLPNVSEYLDPASYSVLARDSRNDWIVSGYTDNGIRINGNFDYIFPNSPYTNIFSQVTLDDDGSIWAAGGLPTNGFYRFDGNKWENYNLSTHPEIGNSNWFQKIVYGNGTVWALGFGGGPTMIRGSEIMNFNPSNSILPGISNDPNFCASYGGAYDLNGAFWVTFFGTNSGSSMYAYYGDQWLRFLNPSSIAASILSQIAVDSYNTKWVVTAGSR